MVFLDPTCAMVHERWEGYLSRGRLSASAQSGLPVVGRFARVRGGLRRTAMPVCITSGKGAFETDWLYRLGQRPKPDATCLGRERITREAVKKVYQHVSSLKDIAFLAQRVALAEPFRRQYGSEQWDGSNALPILIPSDPSTTSAG